MPISGNTIENIIDSIFDYYIAMKSLSHHSSCFFFFQEFGFAIEKRALIVERYSFTRLLLYLTNMFHFISHCFTKKKAHSLENVDFNFILEFYFQDFLPAFITEHKVVWFLFIKKRYSFFIFYFLFVFKIFNLYI